MLGTLVTPVLILDLILAAQVELLGDSRPRKREEAARTLKSFGYLGAFHARNGLKHKDLEVRRRCELIVKEYQVRVIAMIKPTGYDFYPWIRFVPKDMIYRGLAEAIVLRRYDGPPPKTGTRFRPEQREATKAMVYELYMAGVPRAKIVEILDEMIERERAAMKRDGLPFPFVDNKRR